MNERRTLASAMTLTKEPMTKEQTAFIHGKPPMEAGAKVRLTPQELPSPVGVHLSEGGDQATGSPKQATPPRRRSKPTKETPPTRTRYRNLLMPLTTRLTPETVERLRRLCLERQLAGIEPCTVQEILEDALQGWFAENADAA